MSLTSLSTNTTLSDESQLYLIHHYKVATYTPLSLANPNIVPIRASDATKGNEILFSTIFIYLPLSERKALSLETQEDRWSHYFNALALGIPSDILPKNLPADEKEKHTYDLEQMHAALKSLANTGFAPALYALGIFCTNIIPIENKHVITYEYFKRASKQQFPAAEYILYHNLNTGNGVEKNETKAIKYLKRAADHGVMHAQMQLAVHFKRQGSLSDSFIYMKMAADQGDIESSYYTGYSYLQGNGVKKSKKQAIRYLNIASTHDYVDAHLMLANIYKNDGDNERMIQYYLRAAESDNLNAHINLACIYKDGIGTKVDPVKAFEHLKKAADLGCPISQNNIAMHYLEGKIIPQSFDLSYHYFKMTAKNPNRDPKYDSPFYKLGGLTWHGLGTAQSNKKAIKYFSQYQPRVSDDTESIDLIRGIKHGLTYSRNLALENAKKLSKENLILETKATFYYYRQSFYQFKKSQFDHNTEIKKIRETYTLLEQNIDVPWELLSREELNKFVYSFTWLLDRAFHFDFTPQATSIEEVNESYSIDHLIPKKKAKKKAPQKKGKPAPTKTPPKPVVKKETPAPVVINAPKPAPAPSPTPEPRPVQPTPKIAPKVTKEKKEKTETAESVNTKITNTLNQLRKRESMMIDFYMNRYKGQYAKLMQALFDKEDMSFNEINNLVPHIAEVEAGETRINSKGGMHILKLGSYTCGGHKPHGGKTTVDRASLADLRQVLSAHYYELNKNRKNA